jgi:thiol-disulfide isomerase/thioredoxin
MENASEPARQSRLRKLVSMLANVVLFVAIVYGVTTFQSRNMLDSDGEPAPPLLGPTLDGSVYQLGAPPARPTVVYFFAPWCKVCALSSGNLVRLRRWRDADDLDIVAVALAWSDEAEVETYAAKHQLNMPVVLGDPALARGWQVYAFPSYYVIDSGGRVARRDIGYSSQLGLWWRAWAVD